MKKKEIKNIVLFLVAAFCLSVVYNVFMVSNNLVVGGVSGLAIIADKLFNIEPWLFMMLVNVFLIIVSFLMLGIKRTIKNSFGTILYPIFVNITSSFTGIVQINDNNAFVILSFACILYGMFAGLIYKSTISSGGTDTIVQLLKMKYKKSTGSLSFYSNIVVVFLGGFMFGIPNLIYATIALVAINIFTDKFILGISYNKMLVYETTKADEINKMIIDNFKLGITKINKNSKMYLVTVDNYDFDNLKDMILSIDSKATLIVSDCYEVINGTINKKRLKI